MNDLCVFHFFNLFLKNLKPIGLTFFLSFCCRNVLLNMHRHMVSLACIIIYNLCFLDPGFTPGGP